MSASEAQARRLARWAMMFTVVAPSVAARPEAPQEKTPTRAAEHAVVVELFTSQGCSTCPPADRLLTAIDQEGGGRVIPLAFHVDSWNHDGWTDPFSSAEWTRRHAFYARKLGAKSAYTPQAVVDGEVEILGSDPKGLVAAIIAAAERPAATLELAVAEVDGPGKALDVRVDGSIPSALRDAKLELMLAVVETGLVTPVKRGENGGRTLQDDHVVRSLERVARVAVAADGSFRHEARLRLAPGWSRPNLAVVAFLQDPRSLAVRGAGRTALLP